jgi:hypothetical protein
VFELLVGGPEASDLGLGEDVQFGLVEARAVGVEHGVAFDEPPADRSFQHPLQDEQVVGDRFRCEPGLHFLGDVAVDQFGSLLEFLE